jgi:4-hydroxybenzoate polyprenyltransferase
MKLAGAFLRLIRWPNLVFIVLTQCLFYYCIILPSFLQQGYEGAWFLTWPLFWWLSASSVLIAAAGYIINDYFDLNIDQVNKPDSIVIQKIIKRRWAIFWHLSLSFVGLVIAFYVSWKLKSWLIAPLNLLCVFLLWFYSTTFKKKFLLGNLIISLLTAWVVFVLYMSELHVFTLTRQPAYYTAITRIFKLAVLYGGFAFIISLVREVVKDMEDIQGDEKYDCRTLPILWGIPVAKVFAAVWLIVLILALAVTAVYGIQLGWFAASMYAIMLITLPSVIILRNLYKAGTAQQFHGISNLIKLVMLTGILSMIFFKWHM